MRFLHFKKKKFRFIVEGTQFFAHKALVCLRCPYLNVMLNSDFKESKAKEVKISEIDKETFELLMEFIYTGDYLFFYYYFIFIILFLFFIL